MNNREDQQQKQKKVHVESELVQSTEVEGASLSPQSTESGDANGPDLSLSPTVSELSPRDSDEEMAAKREGDVTLVNQQAKSEEESASGWDMGTSNEYRRVDVVSMEHTHTNVDKPGSRQPIVSSRIQVVNKDSKNLEESDASYHTAQDINDSQTSMNTPLDRSVEASRNVNVDAEGENEGTSDDEANGMYLDDSEDDESTSTQDKKTGRTFENSSAFDTAFYKIARCGGEADASEEEGEVQPYPLGSRDHLNQSTDDSVEEDEVEGRSFPRVDQSETLIGQATTNISSHGLSSEASDVGFAVSAAFPRSLEEGSVEGSKKIESVGSDSDEEEEEHDDDTAADQGTEAAKETSSGGLFNRLVHGATDLVHGATERGKQLYTVVAHPLSSVTESFKQQPSAEETAKEEEEEEKEDLGAGAIGPNINANAGSERVSADHHDISIPPLVESFEDVAEEADIQQMIDTHEASATAQEKEDGPSVGSSIIPERELAQPVHLEEGSAREASPERESGADVTEESFSSGPSTPDIPAARQDDAAPFTTYKSDRERPTSAPPVPQDTTPNVNLVLKVKSQSNANRDEGVRVIASPRVVRAQQTVLPAQEETGTPYQAFRAKPTASDDQNDIESISSDEEALTPSPAQQTSILMQDPYAPLPGVDNVFEFISDFLRFKKASRAQSTGAHEAPTRATPSLQRTLNTPPHQPTRALGAQVRSTQGQSEPRVTPSSAAPGARRNSHEENRGIFSGCCGKVPNQSSASSVSLNRYSYDQPREVEQQRVSYRPHQTTYTSYF